MKRLLRGVIDFGSLSQEALAYNYQRLQASGIQWVQPADERIYRFVKDFFESELDLPKATVLADFYKRSDDHECLERLKDIKSAPSYEGANYSYVLKGLVEDQNRIRLMTLLKESQEVAQKGLVVEEGRQKKRIEGVADAISYFQQHANDLLQQDANAMTRGELREAAMDAKQDYQVAEANPSNSWGALTGIEVIDQACHGLKRGEMWIHAAYTGELKSTFALTWCYNLVTRYRRNVFYASLEMPFKQVRNLICCLHTSHPKWALQGKRPLDYRKIRDGELTKEEKAFYFEALDDFFSNDEYARFELWCPDHDVTVAEIKLEAELLHKQMDVGFLCIDHGGLVIDPRRQGRNTTEELNAVMRDCKKLALHFNHGEGLPVLSLFQINRLGKDEAEKNKGRYKLKALTYSNEAEKSADYVTTTYLDDNLREAGRTIFCNLKNRDNPHFPVFEAGVDFTCRRIYSIDPGESMTDEADADEMDELLDGV
jgi:replicative DNA helicase